MVLPALVPAAIALGKVAAAAISALAVLSTALVTEELVQENLDKQEDLIDQCKTVTNDSVVTVSDNGQKVEVSVVDMSEEIIASINEKIEFINKQYGELVDKFSNLKTNVDDNNSKIELINKTLESLSNSNTEVMDKVKDLTQLENEMVTKMNQSFDLVNKMLENFSTLPGLFKMVFFGILFLILLYAAYRVVKSLMDFADYRMDRKRQTLQAYLDARKVNQSSDSGNQSKGMFHRGFDKF